MSSKRGNSPATVRWLTENACDLHGKTAVLTGSTGSLGQAIAMDLAGLGARLILAARNEKKVAALQARLHTAYPAAEVRCLPLDMADFASIERFAATVGETAPQLDLLIQNAGIYHNPVRQTADGVELHLMTNAVGPLCLIARLLPLLDAAGGRVIVQGSIAADYPYARVDADDPQSLRARSATVLYGRSKRILSLGMLALARRTSFAYPRVRWTLVHPGISATNLFAAEHGGFSKAFNACIVPLMRLLFMPPEKACLSAIAACCAETPAGVRIGPRGLFHAWGWPAAEPLPGSYTDTAAQERLYALLLHVIPKQYLPAAFAAAARPE